MYETGELVEGVQHFVHFCLWLDAEVGGAMGCDGADDLRVDVPAFELFDDAPAVVGGPLVPVGVVEEAGHFPSPLVFGAEVFALARPSTHERADLLHMEAKAVVFDPIV